jgi:hypothetical protein
MADRRKLNHRVPWTPTADLELSQRVAEGQFVPQIAVEMGRSQEAIRTRAGVLGLSIRFAAERRRKNQGVAAEQIEAPVPPISR